MAPRRTNYSKMRKNPQEDGIGDPPKRYVYQKKDDRSVRIRVGPGLQFEHNGKFVGKQKKVEIVEIQNGWGLLAAYESTRDGWVCLKYVGDAIE